MKRFSLFAVLAFALVASAFTAAGDWQLPAAGILKLRLQQFAGATGINFVRVPDNVATALTVEDFENGGDLMTLTTTNSSESINVAARHLKLQSLSAGVTASTTSAQGIVAASGLVNVLATQADTVAVAGDSFTLPSAVAGLVQMVCNGAASNAMDVFPFTSDSINKETADTAISLAAGECMFCMAFTTVKWGCVIGSAN